MSDNTATPGVEESPKPSPPPSAAKSDDGPEQLPSDHPLVKSLAAMKDEIKVLKGKASRLDEIEEASKSEAQRQAERLAAAEAAAANAEAKVLRRELALEHQLTKDDAALLDTITDEDAMKALALRLKQSDEPSGPRTPRPDASQGRSAGAGPMSNADSFAEFFRQSLPS